jgi:integrative and conjugative element protein (TIGR02256 family)
MAGIANAILDRSESSAPLAVAISDDFLNPGKHAPALEKAYASADFVFDFSASVAVSRRAATSSTTARHISAFLTPSGTSLVITAEDQKRAVRLDWLEMLHYRMILNEPSLRNSLQPQDKRFRYGNSCRDASFELSQDNTALWAATASKALKEVILNAEANVIVFSSDKEGRVSRVECAAKKMLTLRLSDWTIRFDAFLVDRMAALRKEKLPNETGGILLGNLNTAAQICSIIDIVESPPDSEEWPTSYIRGCAGLRERVEQVENETLSQVGYVGEWHSHPRGAAVTPSTDDLKAYGWLTAKMTAEALPAIMLIIGDRKQLCLVSTS